MKTGYYTIKNTFKESDPESKGIVSRYVGYMQQKFINIFSAN